MSHACGVFVFVTSLPPQLVSLLPCAFGSWGRSCSRLLAGWVLCIGVQQCIASPLLPPITAVPVPIAPAPCSDIRARFPQWGLLLQAPNRCPKLCCQQGSQQGLS